MQQDGPVVTQCGVACQSMDGPDLVSQTGVVRRICVVALIVLGSVVGIRPAGVSTDSRYSV